MSTAMWIVLLTPLLCIEGKMLRGSKVIEAKFYPWDYSNGKPLAGLVEEHKHIQPSATVSESSSEYESFFSRMSDALGQFIAGLVMIIFSVPVLWFNEKRSAMYETLVSRGEQDCREVTEGEYDEKNTNWPVHVTGETKSTMPIEDSLFNVRYSSGVMKLSRCVEIYQWEEVKHERKEQRETLGGGKETKTVTTYEYKPGWLAKYEDGKDFKEIAGHLNKKPIGIESGSSQSTCDLVEFGKGFVLADTELGQLGPGSILRPGDKGFPDSLQCKKNDSLKFIDGLDGYLYTREGGLASANTPEIGDVRVQFYSLPDGPATVVGLQYEGNGKKGGFLPFRVIERPIFSCSGLSEEAEKELLRKEGEKKPEEYANESIWGGWCWCFCCPCNIVAMCCAALMHPELQHAYLGTVSKTECFDRIKNNATIMKWAIRLLGWLLMFIGLCCLFAPFTTFIKVLPFIGPFLSSVGGAIVGVFSFIVTAVIAIFIICLAYLVYHPCMGMLLMTGLAGIIAGILALTHNMAKTKAA